MNMKSVIQIAENDNVAVALVPIKAGTEVQTEFGKTVTVAQDILQGHKIALHSILAETPVIKYGYPIGCADTDIDAGCWVHSHNMKTNLENETGYTYEPCIQKHEKLKEEFFAGYQRPNGCAGVRNEIWIIPTVGCVNDVAKRMAQDNQDLIQGSVDGIYAFTHPFGCSQTGNDHAQTRKLLAALVRHPNAGAVLVLSLGCENLTREQFIEELGDYDTHRIQFLTCQDVKDEFEEGRKLLKVCVSYASGFRRERISTAKLVIGMKCGASDGLSGITANPVVGKFSDLLIKQGGSTILTEVPEMFGAEGMLMNRCKNEAVYHKVVNMINGFKDYFISHHEVVYDNPSPGNKQGGITTLEDKSCGCVQKGGTALIMDVIDYGGQAVNRGLNLLYGPGNDLVSSTALTAAGAQIILFTTGRGTPFGAPAPTIKIATNSLIAQNKKHWIDFNAGTVAAGESSENAARRLLDYVKMVAGGKKTKNEKQGFREIAIFKDGIIL